MFRSAVRRVSESYGRDAAYIASILSAAGPPICLLMFKIILIIPLARFFLGSNLCCLDFTGWPGVNESVREPPFLSSIRLEKGRANCIQSPGRPYVTWKLG